MNTKFYSLLIVFITLINCLYAQTNTFPSTGSAGIGTTSPASSSLLEIKSTTKGLLIPRMTQTQRNAISSPATGLSIYQTDNYPGFYYYDGSAWNIIGNWKKNGTSVFFNTGNVGFGTLSPAYKIDVKGGDINLSSGNSLRINKIRVFRDNPNSGDNNVFVGDYVDTVSSVGFRNVAVGSYAMAANQGAYNTAVGSTSLQNNTYGTSNTAIGEKTLLSNTTGSSNAALGSGTLQNNATGSDNVAIGFQSSYNSTADGNVSIGYKSLYTNTAQNNIAVGNNAMYSNTTGNNNTAIGLIAMYENTTGQNNTAMGSNALYGNTIQSDNSAFGNDALNYNTGGDNTAVGSKALFYNSSAFYNTAVGFQAAYNLSTGSDNTAIGYNSGFSSSAVNNGTAIGGAAVAGSNQVMIGNSEVTSIGGIVGWTNFSDGRYKQNIQQNVPGLAFINKLQPITYTLNINGINNKIHDEQDSKTDSKDQPSNAAYDDMMKKTAIENSKIIYSGFIAQDVEKAAQSLNYNFNGVDKPKDDTRNFYGLRYSDFVVPLVKAVQELSRMNSVKDSAIQQQNIKINDLQNQINELKSMIVSNQSTVNGQQLIVSSASLQQNVPNPFGSSTSINYSLPQVYSSAKIIITDSKGVTLKQISLNTKGKGNINIDASTLASGAYQYTLYIDDKLVDTKRMLLTK